MLVFSKEKLVFLSVPKTGTTAYQAALEPYASMILRDPPELKHAPVFRYNRFFRPSFEKFIGEDLTVIAVMREPLDWLGSWYRYRQRPFLDGRPVSTRDISFDAFVDAYSQGNKPQFANIGSQAKFLEPQKNGCAVTHLFRYEDQSALIDFLQSRLRINIKLKQMNASPQQDLALSEKTKKKFRTKCAIEYDLYESIGADGSYTPMKGPVRD